MMVWVGPCLQWVEKHQSYEYDESVEPGREMYMSVMMPFGKAAM